MAKGETDVTAVTPTSEWKTWAWPKEDSPNVEISEAILHCHDGGDALGRVALPSRHIRANTEEMPRAELR